MHFGGLKAVDGATFSVKPGSVTALIGPNGAGKTTAFNLLTGFIKADAGRVRFADHDISGARSDLIARLGMVRTFQLTRVLAKMTVIENVMLGAPDQPGAKFSNALFRPRRWRAREAEVREQARALLAEVGIESHAHEYAATLSGGQRKLLELARALMTEPRLVLLDEPMAGVNPTLGRAAPRVHPEAARGARHDGPLRRARHGRGDGPLGRGDRDGRGRGHRPRHAPRRCGPTRGSSTPTSARPGGEAAAA